MSIGNIIWIVLIVLLIIAGIVFVNRCKKRKKQFDEENPEEYYEKLKSKYR